MARLYSRSSLDNSMQALMLADAASEGSSIMLAACNWLRTDDTFRKWISPDVIECRAGQFANKTWIPASTTTSIVCTACEAGSYSTGVVQHISYGSILVMATY